MKKKGMIFKTVVTLALLLIVLAALVIFLFPRYGASFKSLTDLSAEESEVDLVSCQLSCSSAKRAAASGDYESCEDFNNYFADTTYCQEDCSDKLECEIKIDNEFCECGPITTAPKSCRGTDKYWCAARGECYNMPIDDYDVAECVDNRASCEEHGLFWCEKEENCWIESDLTETRRRNCHETASSCTDDGYYWCDKASACWPNTKESTQKCQTADYDPSYEKDECESKGYFWCEYKELIGSGNTCDRIEQAGCYVREQDCTDSGFYWCPGTGSCYSYDYTSETGTECIKCTCHDTEQECTADVKCVWGDYAIGAWYFTNRYRAYQLYDTDEKFCMYAPILNESADTQLNLQYDFASDSRCTIMA